MSIDYGFENKMTLQSIAKAMDIQAEVDIISKIYQADLDMIDARFNSQNDTRGEFFRNDYLQERRSIVKSYQEDLRKILGRL